MLYLVMVAAAPALAQPGATFSRCLDQAGGVGTAMLECGHDEVGRWDRRLNAAYRSLLNAAAPPDARRLRAEQRAWLAHHLAETRRLAAAPDNGSAAFLDSQRFELADLSARTIVLERRLGTR